MIMTRNYFIFQFLVFLWMVGFMIQSHANHVARHTFVVKEARYTRLCSTKNILTVNGQYPGPTLHAHRGQTIIVDVHNQGTQNITIHWHGVKQPRNPWSDGPEYVTQCPIQPGAKFSQKIVLSDEEGTLWWHAHSDWSRATVHGPLIIYPKHGTAYPFPKPHAEVPIILGEWWKTDIQQVLEDFLSKGGGPAISDALTINGQPGDLYPCSNSGTFNLNVDQGKTYMLRMINAAMNSIAFFGIAKHNLTVVGSDGAYTKPFKSDYISISPGQTLDILLEANQPHDQYYMAAKFLNSNPGIPFDNTTTTAIVNYIGGSNRTISDPTTSNSYSFPRLVSFNDTVAAANFTGSLRSLASKDHPIDVPLRVSEKLFYTVSINVRSCDDGSNRTCDGPMGLRVAGSINNVSFDSPRIAILESYYRGNSRLLPGGRLSDKPPLEFNYTSDSVPPELLTTRRALEVKVLKHNAMVELVFQGTSLLGGVDHPMHLHGHSFYVVGWGFGNFDEGKDPLNYNLVDPPLRQTIAVPRNGWTAVRFQANNPGVWLMHCHLERHLSWGMEMVFIVRNGKRPEERMWPRPAEMPPC